MYLSDRPSRDTGIVTGAKKRVSTTVVLVGLVSMFTDISSESVSAVLPLYVTAVIGLGPLAYGFIDGIYQGVSALVRILGGWLADRADHPKWIALFGYGISAISRVALIPAATFASLTAVITVDRLGKGVRTAPRDAVIAASASPETLGRAFGVHRTLDTVGAMIGPLLAFLVLAIVPGDFQSVFVVSFAAAIVGLAILFFAVPDVRPRRQASTDYPATKQPDQEMAPNARSLPSLRLLLDKRFGLLIGGAGLLGILTIGDGFLYLALSRRDDLAIAYFPLLYVGTNIAYLALAVPLGRLADRIGRAKVFVAGHACLVATYFLAGGPLSGTAVTLMCLVLLGVFYAGTDGVLSAMSSHLIRAEIRASGIATTQTVVALARFVSAIGFGLLWTLLGADTALILVASALAIVVPIAWALLKGSDMVSGAKT